MRPKLTTEQIKKMRDWVCEGECVRSIGGLDFAESEATAEEIVNFVVQFLKDSAPGLELEAMAECLHCYPLDGGISGDY